MKNTFILAVLLTGTTLSAVLGMQTQVYRNGVLCEQCSTGTHQYDNTVTYNKHSTSPGTTYYTEQRVVTSSNGAPVSTSSDYISTGTTTSNHNTQVTYEGSAQGCSRSPCGTGARCQETVGGRPVCSCPPGYQGNPLTYCHRSGCLDHNECGSSQVCKNGECVNPCIGTCGVNANCEVRNRVPTCSCPKGYRGDPFSSCRQMDPVELCHPTPCGTNTKCDVINNVATCSCLSGYTGNPIQGCRHECEHDSECGHQQHCSGFKCVSACDQCGKGADCKVSRNHRAVCECPTGYIGSPYTECRAECYGDRDCPSGRPACIYGICKNPCDGACGTGADCNLRGLTPICSCPKTHTGNPFHSCRPFTKEDLCNPNPCGTNAQCNPGYDNTHKERPVCTCLPGFVGNPLSHCQRGECQVNEDCPDHRACSNNQCINPCQNQCGVNAECESRRHVAVCKCPQGYSGDALVSCTNPVRVSANVEEDARLTVCECLLHKRAPVQITIPGCLGFVLCERTSNHHHSPGKQSQPK